MIDPNISLKLNDEVEFTYITDPQTRKFQAIRISILPNGTIFNIFPKKSEPKNESKFNIENNNFPLIDLSTDATTEPQVNNSKMRLNGNSDNYTPSAWQSDKPFMFDSAYRNASSDSNNYLESFSNGHDMQQQKQHNGDYFGKAVGLIVAVKESYCFIESIDGENEYFGHQSGYLDEDLEMGQTVEFTGAFLNGKWKATDIRRTRQPAAKYEGELSDLYTGIVLRTIQMFKPEQAEYCGLIARSDHLQTLEIDLNDALNIEEKYEFSMTSFKFLKDYISVGDMVKFQVGTSPVTKKLRAYNIEVLRERIKVRSGYLVFCVLTYLLKRFFYSG